MNDGIKKTTKCYVVGKCVSVKNKDGYKNIQPDDYFTFVPFDHENIDQNAILHAHLTKEDAIAVAKDRTTKANAKQCAIFECEFITDQYEQVQYLLKNGRPVTELILKSKDVAILRADFDHLNAGLPVLDLTATKFSQAPAAAKSSVISNLASKALSFAGKVLKYPINNPQIGSTGITGLLWYFGFTNSESAVTKALALAGAKTLSYSALKGASVVASEVPFVLRAFQESKRLTQEQLALPEAQRKPVPSIQQLFKAEKLKEMYAQMGELGTLLKVLTMEHQARAPVAANDPSGINIDIVNIVPEPEAMPAPEVVVAKQPRPGRR